MTDIVSRLRRGVLTHQERRSTELEAADEIERLRRQLSRHEWAESADRALMQEEIEHQRDRAIWLQEQLEEFQKATS